MKIRTSTVCTASLLLALCASGASAQPRWGRERAPAAGACFYRDANFSGDYFCVPIGEPVAQLPSGMNDGISSIRLFGRAGVTVYRDAQFRGRSARFDTDVRDLGRQGWNDQISSVQVTRSSIGWDVGRPPVWGGSEPVPREGACFYKDADFRGEHFCMTRGGSYSTLPPGFNDQISSIRVNGAGVMIFQDAEFGGRSSRVDSDVPNLGGFWNDKISSIRVY